MREVLMSNVLPIKPKPDQPPAYLVDPERALWTRLQAEYGLRDAPALVLLEMLCRSLTLARECREKVEADGKIAANGREHPLLKVWRDAEKQAAAALKALNFDLEPLR